MSDTNPEKDVVFFDLDETLIHGDSPAVARESGLRKTLQDLLDAGKKLFIVSATDPPPNGITYADWLNSEKQRKCTRLEEAGLPPSLFEDIIVSLPVFDCPSSPEYTAQIIQAYAIDKARVMEATLLAHSINPGRVLSIGDREDIEGVASKGLRIDFIHVPPAHTMRPTDTLQWILETKALGVSHSLPKDRTPYCLSTTVCDHNLSDLFQKFHAGFEQYVRSRLWHIIAALRFPTPEATAPDFNQYTGHLESVW
jgi:hypothetical protein